MPQYLSPGVYVEETPPKARPIAGVGTSTAGFVGVVADNVKMPPQPGKFLLDDDKKTPQKDEKGNPIPIPYTVAVADEPHLITGWEQFKTKFGEFQEANRTLAHAVYGFFNNGGTRCWVIRVSGTDKLADLTKVLDKFKPIDEITIVAVPGAVTKAQHESIIDHCENMRDRVAVLDGTRTDKLTVSDITASTRDSNYAALYYPWIKIFDPSSVDAETGKNGTNISQPPSGHIAGVYARVDGERGVYKAPANEVIRGAVDLENKLAKGDQDGLNPEGVNVIRAFDSNIKIWGARTLGGDRNGEFKYISTRRYFNFLRESIDEGTQFVVFEPNSPALWERIKRTVSDFLLNQWRDGALFGETPKQAFFVKCDAETNPAEVRELGQVVTLIGVAIVKPAEFVIFRIEQTAG